MSSPTSTTLPLPVKVVRAAATRRLKRNLVRLEADLREQVEAMNVYYAVENAGFLHRLFRRPDTPLLDVDATVKRWMAGDRTAPLPFSWWLLDRPTTLWWRRLEQLVLLPECDDDLVMNVSLDDLDLIQYDAWRAK